jgi:hypothetical protein
MVDALSTIKVRIEGDAKGLANDLRASDKAVGGLGASLGKLGGAFALGAVAGGVVAFGETALAEADRLGDATTRLELQLGDLSSQLVDSADNFTKLGGSSQDVLELEASFADFATTLQLSDANIVKFTDDAAATALAIALLTDMEAPQVIDLIGKAADGSEKAMKALGISVTDAEVEARALADTGKSTADSLTAGELAAASYALVLEELKPKLDAVAQGSGDVEQKSAELEARFETLSGRIGQTVEGPMTDFLGGALLFIDLLPQVANFIGETSKAVGGFMSVVFGAVDAVTALIDALGDLIGAQDAARRNGSLRSGSSIGPGISDSSQYGTSGTNVSVYVNPFDAADVEKQTVAALNAYYQRNGSQTL